MCKHEYLTSVSITRESLGGYLLDLTQAPEDRRIDETERDGSDQETPRCLAASLTRKITWETNLVIYSYIVLWSIPPTTRRRLRLYLGFFLTCFLLLPGLLDRFFLCSR